MTPNTNFSSNGTSKNNQEPKFTCLFCHTTVAMADPDLIQIVKETDSSQKIFFHITDLRLTSKERELFKKISSGEVLQPLKLSNTSFKNFKGYIRSLYNTRKDDKKALTSRSNKIFELVIVLDRNRSEEVATSTLPSKNNVVSLGEQFEKSLQKGGGFGIAAAVAS